MNTVIYREDGSHLPSGMLTDEQRDMAFHRLGIVREVRDQARDMQSMGATYGDVNWDPLASRMVELEADLKSKLDADYEAREQMDYMVCLRLLEGHTGVRLVAVDPEDGTTLPGGNLMRLYDVEDDTLGVRFKRFHDVYAPGIATDSESDGGYISDYSSVPL